MPWLTTCTAAACLLAPTVLAASTARPGPAPGAAPAAPPAEVAYRPPVDSEVVDPFRAPTSRYGPGNRGVDYATVPGTPVAAAAAGVVAFAGPVAGSLHVTVHHADGIRTTYAFLASVSVRRGQGVAAGDELGRAGASLHWSARAGDAYLDPLALLARDRASGRARLVPDEPGAPPPRP